MSATENAPGSNSVRSPHTRTGLSLFSTHHNAIVPSAFRQEPASPRSTMSSHDFSALESAGSPCPQAEFHPSAAKQHAPSVFILKDMTLRYPPRNRLAGKAPTTAPDRQVASVPATSVFHARSRKVVRRSGSMMVRPPIKIPIEPKFAKPQMAWWSPPIQLVLKTPARW